jgi:hypothetical protein
MSKTRNAKFKIGQVVRHRRNTPPKRLTLLAIF